MPDGPRAPPADRRAVIDGDRVLGRSRSDGDPQVHHRQPRAGAVDQEPASRRERERVRGAVEQGQRRDDDGRAGPPISERNDVQRDGLPTAAQGDRMQPERHVVIPGRHEIGDAGLGRAPRARQHRERSGVAGRRIAAGFLARVRTAPVDRLVGPVADGRERQEAPPDDPVGDLESPSHLDHTSHPADEPELIVGEWLARRQDPAYGRPGQSLAGGIAPAVREVSHDEMARAAVPPEVDRQLVIHQDPAPPGRPGPELERQAAEDGPPVREPAQRTLIQGMEASGDLAVGGVPRRGQVDRVRQSRDGPRAPDGHASNPPTDVDWSRR